MVLEKWLHGQMSPGKLLHGQMSHGQVSPAQVLIVQLLTGFGQLCCQDVINNS